MDEAAKQAQSRQDKIDRVKPWRFKPGQSGNPKGRAKGISYISENYRRIMSRKLPQDIDFKKLLQELIEEGLTVAGFMAFMQIKEAAKGKTAAISEIADRTEGRPAQELRHTGAGGGAMVSANFNFKKLSTDKLERLEQILLEAEDDETEDNDDNQGSGADGAGEPGR